VKTAMNLKVSKDLNEIGRGLNSCGYKSYPVAGSCEHGNEPSDLIKVRKYLEQTRGCQFLKGSTVLGRGPYRDFVNRVMNIWVSS
jgi:hypothetical protein